MLKKVYAVEPNQDMLSQGIEYCNDKTNIEYILGSAEDTNLEDKSVDIVFAVQSFHWFNKESAKNEVKRILKKMVYLRLYGIIGKMRAINLVKYT